MKDPTPKEGQIVSEGKEGLKKRVIIAEDDPQVRPLYVRHFTRLGYEVEAVENGQLLLEKLRENKYDLVITDNSMPKMNGIDVLKEIRAGNAGENTHIPVILNSSDRKGGLAEEVQKLKGRYLAKPVSMENLKIAAERALSEAI